MKKIIITTFLGALSVFGVFAQDFEINDVYVKKDSELNIFAKSICAKNKIELCKKS